MRPHNLELDMLLRGIVMTRGESGATISEMREDYLNIVGQQWPLYYKTINQTVKYLMEIDGLVMEKQPEGVCIWYIDDIGSNISRELDSNNNVIMSESVSVANVNDTQPSMQNNSYNIPAPRVIPDRIVTSSFVNESHRPIISEPSSDVIFIESIEKVEFKRCLSQDINGCELNCNKRQKLLVPDNLPLNEQNLDIHNRENGTNLMVKQVTSTEIENSICIQNDLNGCIESNDYIVPINDQECNVLRRAFSKDCQIKENSNMDRTVSQTTATSVDEFLPNIGLIGDDFMRFLISHELFGSDFTDYNDKRFGYCISGQTINDAFHMVLDKRPNCPYVLVNVGAIDILLEKNIIDMCAHYARLIKTIVIMGMKPIITTIPNLWINPNYPNKKIIYQSLLLFNQFILHTYSDKYLVIDLHLCLTEPKDNLPVKYYHTHPKMIHVGNKSLQIYLWNANGRKKIVDTIAKSI